MNPLRKNAIERLLNTLGKKMVKDRYNLDLNFEVVDITGKDSYYKPNVWIYVQTDKALPPAFRNKQVDDWSTYRYDNLNTFRYNLGKLLKYLGMNDAGLVINPQQLKSEDEETLDENEYINFPEKFLPLRGETFVLDKTTGYVHFLVPDTNILDEDNYYHLSDIDDDWFWSGLTPQDKRNIEELYG